MKNALFVVPALLVCLCLAACGPDRSHMAGKYQAATPQGEEIGLSLMEDGRATWTTPGETVELKWSPQGDELWLHTREGGVLTAKVKNSTLTIEVPGVGELDFHRVK